MVALPMALQLDAKGTVTGVGYGAPLPSSTLTVKPVVPLADNVAVPRVRLLKLTLGPATELPSVADALVPLTVALAVTVSAPVVAPASKDTVATPLLFVNAEPAVGLNVANAAVNVTTAPATGRPVLSRTVAFNVPGLSPAIDAVEAPLAAVSVRATLGGPATPPLVPPAEVKALAPPQPAIRAIISGITIFFIRPTMCCYASEYSREPV